MIKKRFFCIKEVIVDIDHEEIDLYKNYFKINTGYDFDININDDYWYTHTREFALSEYEINEFFIPLEEWRELQINKILDE
jgi:hypothetical protein